MSKKVLLVTSNVGIEHDELIDPLDFLTEHGYTVVHASIEAKEANTVEDDTKPAFKYSPDLQLSDVDAQEYDLLVIPGGTVNADQLRVNEHAQMLIQTFADQQKPIAAICHAPWVFINAGRIKDKTLTSYHSIRLDLENAGAHWLNEPVHRCEHGGWVLISSRCPDDIPAFNQAILDELEGNAS